MRVLGLLVGSALLILSGHVGNVAASCPPDAGDKLTRSIQKIRRFLALSRHSSSFNYDRLDFLLTQFDQRERAWAACGKGLGESQERLFHQRLHTLESPLAKIRALPAGKSPSSASTIRDVERLLSGVPPPDSARLPTVGEKEPPEPSNRSISTKTWIAILLVLILFGALALFGAFRASRRPFKETQKKADRMAEFRRLGVTWAKDQDSRKDILALMKETISRGKAFVRIRAQLIKRRKGGKVWEIVDEVTEDEGGRFRTFGEISFEGEVREEATEVSLGDDEIRTRIIIPISDGGRQPMAMVVDALSSPRSSRDHTDPSGLRSLSLMKEVLFEASQDRFPLNAAKSVGVISFFFDTPDLRTILEREDRESSQIKAFIVKEVGRVMDPSMDVFGERPCFFHLVVSGRMAEQTGALVRKISKGFGTNYVKGDLGVLEKPWFKKILVAYTRWKEPDPESIDRFLMQIQGNLKTLRKNPSIGAVIDV